MPKTFNYWYQVSLQNGSKLPLDAKREFLEKLNFEKIVVSFVKESQRMNGKVSFPFDYLERMCIDLLNANDICTSRIPSRCSQSD